MATKPPTRVRALSIVGFLAYELTPSLGGAYREGLITNWLNGLGFDYYVETIWENERFGPWWYTIEMGDQWNRTNVRPLPPLLFFPLSVRLNHDQHWLTVAGSCHALWRLVRYFL